MVLTRSIRTWDLDLAKRPELVHVPDKKSHSQQAGLSGESILASFQTQVGCGVLGAELLTVSAYLLMWERTSSVRKWGGLCTDSVRVV
jgi:hypothetical protein